MDGMSGMAARLELTAPGLGVCKCIVQEGKGRQTKPIGSTTTIAIYI